MPSLRDQLFARVALELNFLGRASLEQAFLAAGPQGLVPLLRGRGILDADQVAEISRRRNALRLRCNQCGQVFSDRELPNGDVYGCPGCGNQIRNLLVLQSAWETSPRVQPTPATSPTGGSIRTWMPSVPSFVQYATGAQQATQVRPQMPSNGQRAGSGGYPAFPQSPTGAPSTPGRPSSAGYPIPPTPGSGGYPTMPSSGGFPARPSSGPMPAPRPQSGPLPAQRPNSGGYPQPGVAQPTPSGARPAAGKKGYQSLIGTQMGGFTLESFLGKGAHGWVFKASHPRANFPLAVKVVPQAVAQQNPVILKRLEREATILRGVQHRNLVRTFGFGREGSYCFMAMEYLDGTTLGDIMAEWGKEPKIDEGVTLFRQVLDGLATAHKHNVIHRDLKPDNIMVTREGVVKIMDFGLAREDDYDENNAQGLTIEGEILGTPHYLSPEQAEAAEIDARADIYTAGATFYHVFTGSVPFDDRKLLRIIRAHLSKRPQALRERNPRVPELLEQIILKMLEKKPEARQQTCDEILKQLEPLSGAQVATVQEVQQQGLEFPEPDLLLLLKEGLDENWLNEDRIFSLLEETNKLLRAPAVLKKTGYTPPDLERRCATARHSHAQQLIHLQARIAVESGFVTADVARAEMPQCGELTFARRLVQTRQLGDADAERIDSAARDYSQLIEDMIFGKMSVRKQLINEQQYNTLLRERSSEQRFEEGLRRLNLPLDRIDEAKRDTIRYMLKKPLPNLKVPRIRRA